MASSRDSDFDRLPAYGLRDDAFVDELRKRNVSRSGDPAYWSQFPSNDDIREEESGNPRRRGRAKDYSGDGVTDQRMCQTEVALRLARGLTSIDGLDCTI